MHGCACARTLAGEFYLIAGRGAIWGRGLVAVTSTRTAWGEAAWHALQQGTRTDPRDEEWGSQNSDPRDGCPGDEAK